MIYVILTFIFYDHGKKMYQSVRLNFQSGFQKNLIQFLSILLETDKAEDVKE